MRIVRTGPGEFDALVDEGERVTVSQVLLAIDETSVGPVGMFAKAAFGLSAAQLRAGGLKLNGEPCEYGELAFVGDIVQYGKRHICRIAE